MRLSDNNSDEILKMILKETQPSSKSNSLSSLFNSINPCPFNKKQLNKYPTIKIDDDFNLNFIDSNSIVFEPPKPLLISGIDSEQLYDLELNYSIASNITSEEEEEPKDINPAACSLRNITCMLEQNFVQASFLFFERTRRGSRCVIIEG